jgi:hypothetical protein
MFCYVPLVFAQYSFSFCHVSIVLQRILVWLCCICFQDSTCVYVNCMLLVFHPFQNLFLVSIFVSLSAHAFSFYWNRTAFKSDTVPSIESLSSLNGSFWHPTSLHFTFYLVSTLSFRFSSALPSCISSMSYKSLFTYSLLSASCS